MMGGKKQKINFHFLTPLIISCKNPNPFLLTPLSLISFDILEFSCEIAWLQIYYEIIRSVFKSMYIVSSTYNIQELLKF